MSTSQQAIRDAIARVVSDSTPYQPVWQNEFESPNQPPFPFVSLFLSTARVGRPEVFFDDDVRSIRYLYTGTLRVQTFSDAKNGRALHILDDVLPVFEFVESIENLLFAGIGIMGIERIAHTPYMDGSNWVDRATCDMRVCWSVVHTETLVSIEDVELQGKIYDEAGVQIPYETPDYWVVGEARSGASASGLVDMLGLTAGEAASSTYAFPTVTKRSTSPGAAASFGEAFPASVIRASTSSGTAQSAGASAGEVEAGTPPVAIPVPQVHHTMDDASVTGTALDWYGTHRSGGVTSTLVGSPVSVSGVVAQARRFAANTSYASGIARNPIGTSSFTVFEQFRIWTLANNFWIRQIQNTSGTGIQLYFSYNAFYALIRLGGTFYEALTTAPMTDTRDGNWHDLAVSCERGTNLVRFKFYLNGALIETKTSTNNTLGTGNLTADGTFRALTNAVDVGSGATQISNVEKDETTLWQSTVVADGCLSDAQIQQLHLYRLAGTPLRTALGF